MKKRLSILNHLPETRCKEGSIGREWPFASKLAIWEIFGLETTEDASILNLGAHPRFDSDRSKCVCDPLNLLSKLARQSLEKISSVSRPEMPGNG
jgi:hypothetical protein